MKPDKLSDNWLFQQHSKQTITAWIVQLKYFSFTRACSAYVNDGDAFRAAFLYNSKQDLIYKITQLGLTLNTIAVEFPIQAAAGPDDGLITKKLPAVINRFKYFEQPGRTLLFGKKVFIWISDNTISIAVSGNKDGIFSAVTEEDFRACVDLETHFDALNLFRAIDEKNDHHAGYISRKKYPELFVRQN